MEFARRGEGAVVRVVLLGRQRLDRVQDDRHLLLGEQVRLLRRVASRGHHEPQTVLFRERHGVTDGPGPIRDDQQREIAPRHAGHGLQGVIPLHRRRGAGVRASVVVLAGRLDPVVELVHCPVVVPLRFGELLLADAEGREVELAGLEARPFEHHADALLDFHLLHRPAVEEDHRRLAGPGSAAGRRQRVRRAVLPGHRDDLARGMNPLDRQQVRRVAQLRLVQRGGNRVDLDQPEDRPGIEQPGIDVEAAGVDHFAIPGRGDVRSGRLDHAIPHDDRAGVGSARNRMHRAALDRQRLGRRRHGECRQGQRQHPRPDEPAAHADHGSSPSFSPVASVKDCSRAANCSRRRRSSSRSK